MTIHSMDEAENLCKRMVIMTNEEFICLGVVNDIKDAYEYGYELNLRIRQMTGEQKNKFYYKNII